MKHINAPIPDAIADLLTGYCTDNGIMKKKVMELALIEWLSERGYHADSAVKQKPAQRTAADDSFSGLGDYSAKHLRKGKMEEGEL